MQTSLIWCKPPKLCHTWCRYENQQSMRFFSSKRPASFVDRYIFEMFTCPKSHPQLTQVKLDCSCHSQGHYICIHCLKKFLWKPSLAASAMCRIILVSASLCSHGARLLMFQEGVHKPQKSELWPTACWLTVSSRWCTLPTSKTTWSCLDQSIKTAANFQVNLLVLRLSSWQPSNACFCPETCGCSQSTGLRQCKLEWHFAADLLRMEQKYLERSRQRFWQPGVWES